MATSLREESHPTLSSCVRQTRRRGRRLRTQIDCDTSLETKEESSSTTQTKREQRNALRGQLTATWTRKALRPLAKDAATAAPMTVGMGPATTTAQTTTRTQKAESATSAVHRRRGIDRRTADVDPPENPRPSCNVQQELLQEQQRGEQQGRGRHSSSSRRQQLTRGQLHAVEHGCSND